MKSKIAVLTRMTYSPVAVLWSDEKPDGAIEFTEGRWGCVMSLVTVAAQGKVAVCSRETVGCKGGTSGMGFGSSYDNFPGGIEYFLSNGNPDFCRTEAGRRMAESMPDMDKGERYIKTPELARKFIEALPIRDIPFKYVVFKPLEMVLEDEEPKNIVFLVNPDQLSALIVLANYGRESNDNVIAPMGAGCQQIGILAYKEAESDQPKAIIGLTDLSARKITNRAVGKDILAFTVPFGMFREMEDNAEGSFLQRDTWAEVVKISGL